MPSQRRREMTERRYSGRLLGGPYVEVTTSGERISAVRTVPPPSAASGAHGDDEPGWILPGLVDLQVNGYAGYDVNAADVTIDEIVQLTRVVVTRGTTTYVPTIVTASETAIVHALTVIAAARRRDPLARHAIAGVHVEGPYLSSEDGARGAHDRRWLRDPDPDELRRWLAAADGLLRVVTIAPERPGSIEYVHAATQAGVRIAVGHTHANADEIHAAADAGASLSTHLGNGIAPVLPRHANPIWPQLADRRLIAGLIADGEHLTSDAFIAMARAKGAGGALLVSDSAALAGAVPGEYRTPVGGSVTVSASGRLALTGSGLLAGSGASLLECLRWAIRTTAIPADVLADMATIGPARTLQRRDRGRLTAGASADLVLLDRDMRVAAVVVAGEPVGAGEPVDRS